MIEMSKERTTRRGRLLTTNHRDGRATYRLWHAKAHVAFLSLLYIIRLYSRINELVFIFVSHLLGQVVQTLVVLRLRDRTVFEEGFQGGHLPVVESPALFFRGQSLPRRLVRCVHRATILPATGIVPCRYAGFKCTFKVVGYTVNLYHTRQTYERQRRSLYGRV